MRLRWRSQPDIIRSFPIAPGRRRMHLSQTLQWRSMPDRSRREHRAAQYNQLLRIEEELAEDAVFVPEEITEKQKAEKMG